MIIRFDANSDVLLSACPEMMEHLASELIDAHLTGKHLVIITRPTCDWMLGNLTLSGRHHSQLEKMRERFSTTAGILKTASTYVDVKLDDLDVLLKKQNCFLIGAREILKRDFCSKTTALVVEDADSDGDLYTYFFNTLKRMYNVPELNFDRVHGGGSQLYNQFVRQVNSGRATVCLVDTDKYSPFENASGTCRKVMQEEQNIITANSIIVGGVFQTLGKEIENLIPFNIIKSLKCFEKSPDTTHLQKILENDDTPEPAESFWYFYDIKEGLNGAKLLEKVRSGILNRPTLDWYLRKLNTTEDKIETIELEGFGAGVVQSLISCDKTLGEFSRVTQTNSWKKEFFEFFEDIIWYLCANKRVFVT